MSDDDHRRYLSSLRAFCDALRPKRILEFGSGASSRVFAEYGQVTSIEYNPPGDWLSKETGEPPGKQVSFIFVQPETESFPRNLFDAFFTHIAAQLGEDPRREYKLTNGQEPIWDLAFIDGAVHAQGVVADPRFPGWVPGDLSYLARASLAGLCTMVARTVVIDDIGYMPPLANLTVSRTERFLLLSQNGSNSEALRQTGLLSAGTR